MYVDLTLGRTDINIMYHKKYLSWQLAVPYVEGCIKASAAVDRVLAAAVGRILAAAVGRYLAAAVGR